MQRLVPLVVTILAASEIGGVRSVAEPRTHSASSPSAGPVMIVLPRGDAYLVLSIESMLSKDVRIDNGAAFNVTYLAHGEPRWAQARSDRERLRVHAKALFEAFRAFCATMGIDKVSVTALVGDPGAHGQLMKTTWTRTDRHLWEPGIVEIHDAMIPEISPAILTAGRDAEGEWNALAAARAFVAKIDAGALGDAWEASSEALRSSTPRDEFEHAFGDIGRLYGKVSARNHLFWLHPALPMRAASPGALVVVRFATITVGGEGIEDVAVRRDPDGGWRVAGFSPRVPVPQDRMQLLEQLSPGQR